MSRTTSILVAIILALIIIALAPLHLFAQETSGDTGPLSGLAQTEGDGADAGPLLQSPPANATAAESGISTVAESEPSVAPSTVDTDTPVADEAPTPIEEIPQSIPERDVNGDFGLDSPPAAPMATAGEQRVVFDGSAIPVMLSVGIERKIVFPGSVTLKLDPAIAPGKLHTTPLGDVVLWKATEPFTSTRALAEDADRGVTYALDLQAVAAAPTGGAPLLIELPGQPADDSTNQGRASIPVHTTNAHRYSYRALTQYAAQQLYAPERLIRPAPGVAPAKVTRDPVRLLRHAEVTALPVASWQAPGVHVTAVKLINNLQRPLDLDPRKLIGSWLTATFQYTRLQPHGHGADTSVVYLVSYKPFEEALGEWNIFAAPEHDDPQGRGDYPWEG